jgi:hypothetical protein
LHYFEGFNVFDLIGQPVAVSFTVRGNVPGVYSVGLRDSTPTLCCVKTFTLAAANTPQYVTVPFPTIPQAAVIPNSNAAGLLLAIGSVAGPTLATATLDAWQAGSYLSASTVTNWLTTVGNALNITDVQLEFGTVSTPIERRPMAQEVAACQRCYWQTDNPGVAMGTASRDSTSIAAWTGPTADAASYLSAEVNFPTMMRVTPSVTYYNPKTGAAGTAYQQNAATSLTASQSGISQNGITLIVVNSNVAARDFVKWHAAFNADF